MLLFGFFPSDVRVRKEAFSLSNIGHKIRIVCCDEKNSLRSYNSISIPRVGKPSEWEGKMTAIQLLKFWIYSFRYLLSWRDFDVLHCHDLTGLPPAIWYKFFFPRTKIIYDSHEIYPEAVEEKKGSLVKFFFLMLEKFCIKFVKSVVGVTKPQREFMKRRYRIKNFLILPNFPMKTEYFAGQKPVNKIMKIVYAGGIHRNRGYEQLVEAVSILKGKREDFIVELVGDGPHRTTIEEMVRRKGLESFITFIGSVHYSQVKDYLNNADIGIALYQPTPNCDYSISNKIFEYIVCELPLIYPYYKGSTFYLKRVGGINVDPTSPKDISRKMDFLLSHPEVRNRIQKAEKEFTPNVLWESIEEKLVDLYKTI